MQQAKTELERSYQQQEDKRDPLTNPAVGASGHKISEGWNFNSGNYLFTNDTK